MNTINKQYIEPLDTFFSQAQQAMDATRIEELIGKFALRIIDDVEKGKLTPIEADYIFSFIDDSNQWAEIMHKMNISEIVNDLLFEGQIMHDLGTPQGADIERMKKISQKLIDHVEESN